MSTTTPTQATIRAHSPRVDAFSTEEIKARIEAMSASDDEPTPAGDSA